ncbi:MAG: hypothetical protein U0V75_01010 [Ferruginibacter sp.]
MKKMVLSACMLACIAACSKKSREFAYTGTLTGPDFTMTACSGGVYFKTENKTYHIDSLPGMRMDSLFRLSFPVAIECNGGPTGKCAGLAQDGYFNVTAYKF